MEISYDSLNYKQTKCKNCGKKGHSIYGCKTPIVSYGIIDFKIENNIKKYLIIRRKDTFGYIEFIRGKYPLLKSYLINIINEMTLCEKFKILNYSFEQLWEDLWGPDDVDNFKDDKNNAFRRFQNIIQGLYLENSTLINLKDLVNESNTCWEEQEWGFPKGKRNHQENDIMCAKREWSEETGFNSNDLQLIENIFPFEEIFIGSNYKAYKHKYFIAKAPRSFENNNNFQKSEVSNLKWVTLDECIRKIRPYNLEKIEIIKNVNKLLEDYNIY